MRIDKDLLPLKIHFFLSSAAIAPVAPFLPLIAKQLGFKSIHVGWIQSLSPVVVVLLKPLAGSVIDRYKCHKIAFLTLLFLSGFFGFCIQWINPLPSSNTTLARDNDTLFIKVCSEELSKTFYIDNLYRLGNSSAICEARVENYLLPELFLNNISYVANDTNEKVAVNIKLGDLYNIEGGCASIKTKIIGTSKLTCDPLLYLSIERSKLEMNCSDPFLQSLVNNRTISDSGFFFTKQFLCLFFLMVGSLLAYSISNTVSDVISFGLLGNKPEGYGAQRIWSPIGWGLSTMVSGFVVDKLSEGKAEKDFTSAFYTMLILMSLDIFVASRIKVVLTEKSQSVKRDLKKLFKKPEVMTFAFWCFLNGLYFSFIWNFVLWFVEDLAASGGEESRAWIKSLDGLVLATQCYVGEIPFTYFSGKMIKKFGISHCMTLVLFGFGLRFVLYSTLQNPWWILPIESLHGITWGLMYASMVTYASRIAPPGAATTVQNICSSLFDGAGTATGGLIGGYLINWIGAKRTFLILGISAFSIGFLHMIIHKKIGVLEEPTCNSGNTKEEKPLQEKEDFLQKENKV